MEATMNQPPSNPGEPTGDPDKKQIPSTIKSVNAAPDAHSAECQCQSKKKNWPQRIEACCAVLLVFITGFYTFYARQQHSCPNCVFDRRGFQSEEEVKALLR